MTQAKPLAIAFDMDGVLIDSQPLHYKLDIALIEACGHPANLDIVTPLTGISNPDRCRRFKESLALPQPIDWIIERHTQIMIEIFTQADLAPIDGIPNLLKFLHSQGIPCAVASSSPHELINLVLDKCQIKQYFAHLISGEDVKAGKPAPDIYLKAAKAFGLPPGQCIAIEDAPSGILAAKNAGFTCIAYINPSTHGQDFTHANYVVSHYDQCHEIISGRL